jgi:[ribosomal protein S5]-alanine N-acetyltransferase
MTNDTLYFPNLQTERLILRQLTLEDTDFVFHHFSDPQVTQYLMDEPPLANAEEAQAIINFFLNPESKTHNRWGIVRKADQRLMGTCGFHKWDKAHFRAEIGYDLAPDCWGQGFMSEALHAVINNGFERMKINRIDAFVYANNPRSVHLLQKLGFKQEGFLRDYFYLNGTFYDHLMFGLLRRDWQK